MRLAWLSALSTLLAAPAARADEIRLHGGRVIEGVATFEGDKVLIELESGRIAVPLAEVAQIERSTAALQIARERERALSPKDVAATLELANFCRDHELRGKERELLERVLTVEPQHAEARRRLGYVKTERGWVVAREQTASSDEQREQARLRKLEREKREVELELAREKLRRAKAERQAPRREPTPPAREVLPYVSPYAVIPAWPHDGRAQYQNPYVLEPRQPAPPRNENYTINGVRDVKSYFDEAQRVKR